MVAVLYDIVEILVHQHDNVLPVGGMDDAAVVAAGVHAAAFACHPDQFRGTGLLAVQIVLGEIRRQHGVVVLLTQDAQHLTACLPAHQLPLCNTSKQPGVVPRSGGAQLPVPVKVQGIMQYRPGKTQLPDAIVDSIQPQIVDDHIGGDIVGAYDHHGGGVPHLQLCSHPQCPQHPTAVYKLTLPVGDGLLQVRFAPLCLQVQRRKDERLDGRGGLKFLLRPHLQRVPLQVVHKNAHLSLIAVQLCGDPLFQCHVFIHSGIFSLVITGLLQRIAGHCARRCPPPDLQ